MIRRRKADVLDQLPVKTRTVIPVPLDPESRAEYDEANRSFLTWLAKTKHVKNGQAKVRGASKAERLTQMGYLLRLAAKLKFGSVVEWTSDFLETGGKLIAFAVQRQLTQDLAAHFGQAAVLVNGSVTGRHRQAAIDRFNRDKSCRLLSGNIEAAGEGWSCKSTSTEMFYQLPWQPGMLMQAEDRIEGIERGLPGAAAQIYFLVAENTIEEWLCKVLIGKRKILDQVMDSQDTGELDSILSQVESMVERSGRMVTDKSKDNRKMVRTAVNDVVRVFMGGL
jgi:SNF2 family DNA or RNA helicase